MSTATPISDAVDTWLPTDTAPEDGSVILGRYDEDEIEIRWSDERHCMLAYGNPGNGSCGPGWQNVSDDLPMDEPQSWQPVAPADGFPVGDHR
jgi:hypothetical protein